MESYYRKPELVVAFQDEHHHVTATNAYRLEKCGGLVAFAFDVSKGKSVLLALVVGPQQSLAVGLGFGPRIYNIVTKIEIIRDYYFKIVHKVLIGLECRFFKESF